MNKNILQDMINDKLSSYQIAEKIGKSQTTVRYWLNKYSLTTLKNIRIKNNLKFCSKCANWKSLEQFYNRDSKRKQSYCKACFNKHTMNRWIDIKLKAIEYKGNKCLDCNNSFPYPIYDFHHLDPSEKDYDWSKLRLRPWKQIINELDKCVLLCSNCHRLRHHLIKKKG